MPKRTTPEPAPKPLADSTADQEWANLTQHEKFIRTAREVEADETGEAMERAFSRAFPPRKAGETVAPYAEREPTKGGRRKARQSDEPT